MEEKEENLTSGSDENIREDEANKGRYGQNLKEKLESLKNQQDIQGLADAVSSVLAELGTSGNITANFVIAKEIKKSSFFSGDSKEEKGQAGEEQEEGEQGQGKQDDRSSLYRLDDEKEMKRFITEQQDHMLFVYMLVLASMRVVEKSRLHDLAEKVRSYITDDRERFADGNQHPLYLILEQINALEYTIVKNTVAGRLELEGVGYPQDRAAKLREIIWKELVYLREPLLEWLLELNRKESYPMGVFAAEAISEYASMDFSYAYDHIIKPLTQADRISGFGTLGRVMTALYINDRYKENIRSLSSHWLSTGTSSKTWLAALSIYLKYPESAETGRIKGKLIQVLSGEDYSSDDEVFKYLGILLCGYKELAGLVYIAAAEAFSGSDKEKKELVCLNVLNLLLYEILMSRTSRRRLNLVDGVNDQECRKQIVCVYRHIWSDWMMRHMMETILDVYLEGTQAPDSSEYMKLFFRMLAFSGKKNDYENMMVYLDKGERRNAMKKELLRWLYELRMARMQQSTNRLPKKET